MNGVQRLLGYDGFFKNVLMAPYTTMHVGGIADVLALPRDNVQFKEVYRYCMKKAIPLFVLGKGSNTIFTDKGFRGVVMLTPRSTQIVPSGKTMIYAEAGVRLQKLNQFCYEKELSGLEFTVGIPGTVGGATVMNAGAYGNAIADKIVAVECLDRYGGEYTYHPDQCLFGNRQSIFHEKQFLLLNVYFALVPSNKAIMHNAMKKYTDLRRQQQPWQVKSAGCIFKKPENGYAGQMIDQCGLKGVSVGGARVSTKHAGIIVNEANATAQDVINLIHIIRDTVRMKMGVDLQLEIDIVGEE